MPGVWFPGNVEAFLRMSLYTSVQKDGRKSPPKQPHGREEDPERMLYGIYMYSP